MKKLKLLGLAGLLALVGCAGAPKPLPVFEDYKNRILYLQHQDKIYIGYDTDNDNTEDLRYTYQFRGYNNLGQAIFDLIEIWDDENRNGIVDDDEVEKVEKLKKIEGVI